MFEESWEEIFLFQGNLKKKNPQDSLKQAIKQAIAEYKRGVRTPETWTAYWRAKLAAIEVPVCDWTEEQILKPMLDKEGKEVPGIMVPVVSDITLPILGRMYPKMRSYTVREDSTVTDIHDTLGWVKVYGAIDAPNLNTAMADAEAFAKKLGYLPGREKTYILGAQASKDLQGKYFDEGSTRSWLPGSRLGGGLVSADFRSDGSLDADWDLDPEIPDQNDGWRFEEVKPKA